MSAGRGHDAEWERLAGSVRGRVLRPGDAGYLVHSELFNRRYRDKRPAAVVCVADAADVQRSIAWARDAGVPVVARSGGHSFAGYSVNDGLVIDLGRLCQVRADESTGLVTVGGGARVGHLYDGVRPYEMAVPAGTNPLVGMAGLALGGGAEYASRKFGLTCDAMVETTIVTPDCQVLTCNEREHPDLFWACRGGGGGNFGVNVSFTFQAQPVSGVTTFDFTWRWADAITVLDRWQHLLRQAPDEFCVRLGASTSGTGPESIERNRTLATVGQLFGGKRELAEILDPVLTIAEPITAEVIERTYWEAKGHLVHATSADAFAMRTNYLTEPIGQEGLATMLSWVERWPGSGSADGGGVGLFAWGGQINRIPPGDTAFVHRDTLFLASMDTAWTGEDGPDTVAANLRWLAGMHEAMAPHVSPFAYQNFADPDLSGWQHAYYGENYARLAQVKKAYDPDGVFQFEQSIRP